MKVLIIPQYGRTGGALTWLLDLLKLHQRHGIETALLIEQRMAWPEIIEKFAQTGAQVNLYPDYKPKEIYSFFAALHDFRRYYPTYRRFQPDLTLVSNTAPLQQNGAFLLPGPLAFLLHTCPNSPHSRRYSFLPQKLISKKKCFVTVSQYAADCIHKMIGIPKNKIDVIYNPAHTPDFISNLETPMVLTASHVCDYRNPDVWYATAKTVIQRYPAARFVWIGDGDKREDLLRRAEQDGLKDKILLPGFSNTPHEWYAHCSVYFQPTSIENHSIAVIDAMACGIPCVVSRVGGLPESVIEGNTGYLCSPEDVVSFSERIIQLLENATLRQQLGTSGRIRATQYFSATLQEKRIIALYQRLTQTKG